MVNNVWDNLDPFHKAFIDLEEVRARPGRLSVSFHYDCNNVWRSSWVLEYSTKIHTLSEGSFDFAKVIFNTAEQMLIELEDKECYCSKR